MDAQIAEEAAVLTGIGIGTAFALLALLVVMVTAFRVFSDGVLDRFSERAAERRAAADAETRLKALAAVAAVTALRRSHRTAKSSQGTDV